MFIDTHCHLNFKDFKGDADEVIKKTLDDNVQMVIIGSQYSTSVRAVEYANKYDDGIWAVVGIHPVHLFKNTEFEKAKVEVFDYGKYLELAKKEEVVGIGEVGLDYHHFKIPANLRINYESTNTVNKDSDENDENDEERTSDFERYKKEVIEIIELQKSVFCEFIRLANEVQKPLVIHCWNADKKDKELVGEAVAYDDILEIVSDNPVDRKGVVHSFIGGYRMAQRFIDKGFLIGLNGIITYSDSYDRLIREVGLENIIIETDAPYLTPAPLERYSRNEPVNVNLVAQKIADVLGLDISEVKKVTTKNAQKLFGI